MHCTHVIVPVSHAGVAPEHTESSVHATAASEPTLPLGASMSAHRSLCAQDAHVFMDACTPVLAELLVNGDFESNMTGWHEIQFDSELISSQVPQAGTYGAWLGSYAQTATDELYQDIAVPAGTTSLVLTGYSLVYTKEATTTNAYDRAYVSLATTTETTLETALTVTNLGATAAYVPFTHSFAVAAVAGASARFKLNSSSNASNYTNFFFDTFSLKATHCP